MSNTDSAFQWIIGGFYFNEDVARFTSLGGPRFDAVQGFLTANVPGFNEDVPFRIGGQINSESFAAFGQGTYEVSEALSVTGGLRYTNDRKDGTNENIFFAPQVIDPVQVRDDAITGRASVDWKFNDSSLLYGSYARGFKSGGVNQTTVASTGQNPVFEPEFVDTFELGLKSRLLDNRLQLNISAFTSDYSDLQFQVFGDFGPEAGNAGAATINGVEVEWQALLTDNWDIDGSFTYTDAEYDELITGPGPENDFSGNLLPRVPEFSFNAGITGQWDFNTLGNVRLRAEGSYTDEKFFEFANGPESLADDFINANFRLFWTHPNDQFYAETYLTNAFDSVQEGNILVGLALGVAAGETGQEFVSFNPPRQYGLTLGYRF